MFLWSFDGFNLELENTLLQRIHWRLSTPSTTVTVKPKSEYISSHFLTLSFDIIIVSALLTKIFTSNSLFLQLMAKKRRPVFSIGPPYNAYKISHNLAPCWRIWIALTTPGTFEIVNHHIFKLIVCQSDRSYSNANNPYKQTSSVRRELPTANTNVEAGKTLKRNHVLPEGRLPLEITIPKLSYPSQFQKNAVDLVFFHHACCDIRCNIFSTR